MCWLSFMYWSLRLSAVPGELLPFIKPEPLSNSSLSTWIEWLLLILLNSERYEFRMSRCLWRVCIDVAAPDNGMFVIFSFSSPNLLSMSSISIEIVSKENSLESSGVDWLLNPFSVPLIYKKQESKKRQEYIDLFRLTLLSATSFISTSFSRFRARLRMSKRNM